MWPIQRTCILSAGRSPPAPVTEMKESPEDKRDVSESQRKWHPAYQTAKNVIPAPTLPHLPVADVLIEALSHWVKGVVEAAVADSGAVFRADTALRPISQVMSNWGHVRVILQERLS